MRVGDLVRIKEIAGTKLASKRWGIIVWMVDGQLEDESLRACTVYLLEDVDWGPSTFNRHRRKVSLQRRHLDYPTDKQVPDWVWVEIAKRALVGDE